MERYSIPVVTVIVERRRDDGTEVLIQTRWKPDRDPVYSGCLEVPAGKIREYEHILDALKREVFEETGLRVLKIRPDIKGDTRSRAQDVSFAFLPYCCHQQLRGGEPWIGFVFVCEVEDNELRDRGDGAKDARWIRKAELRRICNETPEKIFAFQLPVLRFYLNNEKLRQEIR